MRLDLGHEIHGHHHHDQQRRAAEVERHVPFDDQEFRQQAHERDINRAAEREPRHHAVDIRRRLVAGADARDEGAGFLQVFRGLLRVEHQRGIEKAEKDDRRGVQADVDRLARRQRGRDIAQPAHTFGFAEPAHHRRRQQDDRRREDRRDHARHVNFERQVTGLAGHHLATDLALGIVHRDAPLAALDEHHEPGHAHHGDEQEQREQRLERAAADEIERLGDRARQPGDDAGENDDRDTVADTALGNLLAEPHQKHGTGHKRDDGHEFEADTRRHHHRHAGGGLRFKRDGDTQSLERRQRHGAVARVLRDLAPPAFALFLQLLELRHRGRHQLHDDGGGDVRHDAEREHRETAERTAGEHVEQADDGALRALEQLGERDRVDARDRDVGADAVDDERAEDEEDALT